MLAPDDEYFPGMQVIQLAEPTLDLYVPALHRVHLPPLCPVKPLLHVHSVAALLPASEVELAGHLTQELFAAAPVAVE
jgi:hypothetical protein